MGMNIIEIDADRYEELSRETHIFSSKDFLELNSEKVDKLLYLVGRDTKERFAFAVGVKEKKMLAPFSAPFASIIPLKKKTTMEQYWDFVNALVGYAKENDIELISFYLPSDIYEYSNNVKVTNALLGNDFRLAYSDVNYSFDLCNIDLQTYDTILHYNARKALKIALKSNLVFQECESIEMKKEAYEIIRINRESRGFPLRMSLEQVLSTIEVVDNRFFLVKHDDISIASAVVFHVTKEIAQVVYWGNIPDTIELKPINYLSYCLIGFYKDKGFKYLDIGISTENGIPNFGLCNFKDSIGCNVSYKCRYVLELEN